MTLSLREFDRAISAKRRRPKEEIERERAEKAARRERKAAKLRKVAEACLALAASFERRAAARAACARPDAQSASMRKAIRKVTRAAAEYERSAEARAALPVPEGREPPPDRGTGLTRLKLSPNPIARLADQKKIGPEELQAVEEINEAFSALASRLMVRGMALERVDRSGVDDRHAGAAARAVANYTAWANFWSVRAKAHCDPTLQIVVAVAVDQWSVRMTAAELGLHHSKVEAGVISGLRDYAARAGFVNGRIAERWMLAAEGLFPSAYPKMTPERRLAIAVVRAKTE